jgi:hypothetical protein
MPLHIFLGDEELLYFIIRVEVVEIQIRFQFKLVWNLQKGLKIYEGFSIFPVSAQLASSRTQSVNGPARDRAARLASRASSRLTQPDLTR